MVQDLIQSGVEWLHGEQAAYTAQQVTYSRGATSAVVPAVVGAGRVEDDIETPSRLQQDRLDFLIRVEDMTSFSNPEIGDLIDHDGSRFAVVADQGVDGPWRWSSGARDMYRIHAIRRGSTP